MARLCFLPRALQWALQVRQARQFLQFGFAGFAGFAVRQFCPAVCFAGFAGTAVWLCRCPAVRALQSGRILQWAVQALQYLRASFAGCPAVCPAVWALQAVRRFFERGPAVRQFLQWALQALQYLRASFAGALQSKRQSRQWSCSQGFAGFAGGALRVGLCRGLCRPCSVLQSEWSWDTGSV
jgi:hypothetical protein